MTDTAMASPEDPSHTFAQETSEEIEEKSKAVQAIFKTPTMMSSMLHLAAAEAKPNLKNVNIENDKQGTGNVTVPAGPKQVFGKLIDDFKLQD